MKQQISRLIARVEILYTDDDGRVAKAEAIPDVVVFQAEIEDKIPGLIDILRQRGANVDNKPKLKAM